MTTTILNARVRQLWIDCLMAGYPDRSADLRPAQLSESEECAEAILHAKAVPHLFDQFLTTSANYEAATRFFEWSLYGSGDPALDLPDEFEDYLLFVTDYLSGV